MRLAWRYVIDQQDWGQLPNFLLSFRFYWDANALGQDAMDLLEPAVEVLRALPLTDVTKPALGRVLAWYGWALLEVGLFERSIAICEEAIDIKRIEFSGASAEKTIEQHGLSLAVAAGLALLSFGAS